MSAATAKEDADRTVDCPACQSPVGERCTAPTETGRRPVSWTHTARTDKRMGWD